MHSITRCTQLICKQDIVVRVTVIVFSFKVDGDVSLIYHKSIDFCNFFILVRLFLFQPFSRWLNRGALKWLEILSDTLSNNF